MIAMEQYQPLSPVSFSLRPTPAKDRASEAGNAVAEAKKQLDERQGEAQRAIEEARKALAEAQEQIANHDFSRVNLSFLTITNDRCRRTRQQDDVFKRLLGMHFLHHTHDHIDEHHSDGDERIAHSSE